MTRVSAKPGSRRPRRRRAQGQLRARESGCPSESRSPGVHRLPLDPAPAEVMFDGISRFTPEPSLLVFCTPFGFGPAVHRAFPGECRVLQGAFLSSEISSRWPYLEGLGPAQGSLRRQPGHPLESQVPERLARPLSERQAPRAARSSVSSCRTGLRGLQLRQWAEVTIQVTSAAASAASSIDSSRPSANASANSASPSFSRAASSVCSRTSSPIA
jgi:hypothetical protein